MSKLEPAMLGRWLAGVLMLTMASSAVAQQPPRKPAAAQPSEPVQAAPTDAPQRTTATYDDWVMQCETQAGSPPQKVCQIIQTTQVQGKNAPFSLVIIPRPAKGQPVKLVVQVPVNVLFSGNVRIRTEDSDSGIVAPFARCLPAGCFAEFDLRDDVLKRFRTASAGGKLSFVDAASRDIAVPLSFKGFVQAYDALLKD